MSCINSRTRWLYPSRHRKTAAPVSDLARFFRSHRYFEKGTMLGAAAEVHCSEPYCRQLDILPFKCDGCSKMYCLEHYIPTTHACPSANLRDRRIFSCPLCLETVPIVPTESVDVTFARHQHTSCRPQVYAQRAQQKRGHVCPVALCKQRLAPANTYSCSKCNRQVCLRHRHPTEPGACCGFPKATTSHTMESQSCLAQPVPSLRQWATRLLGTATHRS